jgi:error-prone DNA polymerase
MWRDSMDGADLELLALWREAGEWWSHEPYREVCRFVDAGGVRREQERFLTSLGLLGESGQRELDEDHSEEWNLKLKKVRNEKYGLRPRNAPKGARLPRGASQAGGLRSDNPEGVALGSASAESQAGRLRHDSRAGCPRCNNPGPRHDNPEGVASDPATEGARPEILRYRLLDDQPVRREAPAVAERRLHPADGTPAPLLHAYSGYAFGRGAMLAEEVPAFAVQAGYAAAAIADPHSLVGCVEFAKACRRNGIRPLIGAAFELPEGGEIVLVARTKAGYRNLSQLVTQCHLGEPRGYPMATWERLERYAEDLLCLTGGDLGPLDRHLIRRDLEAADHLLERLIRLYGREYVFIQVERSFLPWEISVNRLLLELAERHGVTPVAGGGVTHARREHFPVQDILACVETLCTVDEIVGRKPPRHETQPQIPRRPERAMNGERFLRTQCELAELYADRPDLVENAQRVADLVEEDVLPERTRMPSLFPDPAHALREITYAGAHLCYPKLTPQIRRRLEVELKRIVDLDFAGHFLAAWDFCRWARDQGIQMSGRGSVVDSAVAYCLGFSRIDAIRHNLHFDRFLPDDGSKRPDIDIDFEAHRRDDVRNYVIRRYGIDRVATVAAVGAYCTRGIVREVGKALGLPPETIGFLAKRIHGGIPPDQIEAALERRPELRGSGIPKERFRWVFRLSQQLMDVPRNIRCHSSGVVVSERPLAETVPVMWSASRCSEGGQEGAEEHLRIIQWDKRSAKHYFDKFDILCLRGQDVLSGTESRVRQNAPDFNVERLPVEDGETYRAMRSGELIGIPQSASPAMRQAHIRLGTSDLHDASLVQAGIRPGVGGSVKLNQLIARRRGLEDYHFEHPLLEEILGHTYGIIVFQEQVDQLLQGFCGCTSGEAEEIRDAIHQRRREDFGRQIREALVGRMLSNGHPPPLAEQVFELIAGFKGYGFAQGHALAFAEISIRSIHCQQNYPAEYFAALLSAQPAGYYGPCTLVNEARSRGVAILGPDVNRSEGEFSVEDVRSSREPHLVLPGGAIRVGLMQVANLSEETRERILSWRRPACDASEAGCDATLSGLETTTAAVPRVAPASHPGLEDATPSGLEAMDVPAQGGPPPTNCTESHPRGDCTPGDATLSGLEATTAAVPRVAPALHPGLEDGTPSGLEVADAPAQGRPPNLSESRPREGGAPGDATLSGLETTTAAVSRVAPASHPGRQDATPSGFEGRADQTYVDGGRGEGRELAPLPSVPRASQVPTGVSLLEWEDPIEAVPRECPRHDNPSADLAAEDIFLRPPLRRRDNPEGVAPSSPGLRGTSYPGDATEKPYNPEGVASDPVPAESGASRPRQDSRAGCPRCDNLEGVASSSPGLRGTSYPGEAGEQSHNPERVASDPASAESQAGRLRHSSRAGCPRYESYFDFCARVRPERDELETLILCGALDGLCPNRRAMLWAIPAALDYAKSSQPQEGQLPLEVPEPPLDLAIADFSPEEKALHERRLLGLDVERHLMAFERERIAARGGLTCEEVRRLPGGRRAIVVGNPIRLRFPPTPSGKRVVFFDLEDETGLLNVTCFDDVYQRDGHTIVCSPYVTLIGETQDRDGHTAFITHRAFPYQPILMRGRTDPSPVGAADFLVG